MVKLIIQAFCRGYMGQYDSWDYLTNFIKKNISSFQDELAKPPYTVKTKQHPVITNLYMFKYSQFESDFTNPIVRCCRGSVYDIREDGTVRPLLMPFFKFANYGEAGADPIDWNNGLYVREKLDGSLIKLIKLGEADGFPRESRDLWTTNGSFDIGVDVPEIYPVENDENQPPPYTFASLRDYALRGHEDEIKRLPELWTFMFELTSPYNKIIVPYRETKLTLLGCRDPNGMEHTPEWAVKNFVLTFDTPKIYPLKNIDEVIAYCKSIDTNDREGVVVQDGNFNRVKIKSEHYRGLSALKGEDNFSDSRLFAAIKEEWIDDALASWPEIKKRTDEMIAEWVDFRRRVNHLCGKAAAYYQSIKAEFPDDPKESKKRYALLVMEKYKPFSTFLFETVKEDGDIEPVFNKIEYKELKNYWIPAMEGAQQEDGFAG
jgi:hypothetical protein